MEPDWLKDSYRENLGYNLNTNTEYLTKHCGTTIFKSQLHCMQIKCYEYIPTFI